MREFLATFELRDRNKPTLLQTQRLHRRWCAAEKCVRDRRRERDYPSAPPKFVHTSKKNTHPASLRLRFGGCCKAGVCHCVGQKQRCKRLQVSFPSCRCDELGRHKFPASFEVQFAGGEDGNGFDSVNVFR